MKISVIMGVYNSEKTLKQSINSLIGQTFQDFELIICDDGSTDKTLEILRSYEYAFKERLRILKNPINKGLAYSLNKCLDSASGRYIARMDADDIAENNRFEVQCKFLENLQEVDMVGSDVLLFDESGVWGRRSYPFAPKKEDFLQRSQFIHPTIMVKRSVLIDLNGYTVEKVTRRTEDYDLFMRFIAEGYKGINLSVPLLLYREDNESYKRRAYRYRLDEARIRFRGFRRLGLLPRGLPYVIRPLVIGLIPHRILKSLKREETSSLLEKARTKKI